VHDGASSTADELAVGRAMDCLLRAPLRAPDLSQLPPRSLVACPATSSTKTIGARRDEHARASERAFRQWQCRQNSAAQDTTVTSPGSDGGS